MSDTPDLTPDAVTHSAATCLLLGENSICEVDCRSLSAALATERARVAELEAALLATTQREAATIARYDARLAKADAYAEAAEAKLATARDDALEEAAQKVETHLNGAGHHPTTIGLRMVLSEIAAAIRAMKGGA